MSTSSLLASLLQHFHWQLSLYAALGIAAASLVINRLLLRVPTFADASQINEEVFRAKMERPAYAANHKWNRKWAVVFLVVIFGTILPFCITLQTQPWWRMLLDIVVILMFYDFIYYLTHRFIFHDGGFFGGPLLWMHAVHHRQLDPCVADSSYIHPLEVAIGLGLYVVSIFVLSRFMGEFHLVTIIISWVAFTGINIHNHRRWTVDRFPFTYLNYVSKMHHNHHATFTGGNFATITLLYDWMFGTLDSSGRPKKDSRA